MTTRLEAFRDWCNRMATAEHKPECPSLGPKSHPVWQAVYDTDAYPDDGIPAALRWLGNTPPPPTCEGCNSDADRALFKRLGTEVDDYLDRDLFSEEDA